MLIDTHCHLDAAEFDEDRWDLMAQAGLSATVVPAVAVSQFAKLLDIAHAHASLAYALGIHPMYVHHAADEDLDRLEQALDAHRDDPQLVAVGEIGLDLFVPEIREGAPRERQIRFFEAQLALARKFELPVILHVRRSQDLILKSLRRLRVRGGIAHAFNGSDQQAQAFVALGFCLGFGGAMTYPRALQIRRLASAVDASALVLETDAPDMPPLWLRVPQADGVAAPIVATPEPGPRVALRNTPAQLERIAQTLAELRGLSMAQICAISSANALRVLPRLAAVVQQGR